MISETDLFNATHADCIYFKQGDEGILFVIKYEKTNGKQDSTFDSYIGYLEGQLKQIYKTETSFLRIISEGHAGSSKVLRFDRIASRKYNPLYKEIFDDRECVLPGVVIWTRVTPPVSGPRQGIHSDVKYDIVKPGSSDHVTDASKGKKRAVPRSNTQSKTSRLQVEDGDPGSASEGKAKNHSSFLEAELRETNRQLKAAGRSLSLDVAVGIVETPMAELVTMKEATGALTMTEVNALKSQLATLNKTVNTLAAERVTSNTTVEKLTAELAASKEAVEKLTNEQATSNMAVERLTVELAASKEALEKITAEQAASNTTVEKLTVDSVWSRSHRRKQSRSSPRS
jgi:cell division protein FtsB